jgi:hypothetical protein
LGKKVIAAIVISLIVGFLIYNIPYSNKVNTTLQGVQCRIGDEAYSEKVTLKIQGNYSDYIFKDDTFQGKILVDKYEYSMKDPEVFLKFRDGYSVLRYYKIKPNANTPNCIGTISIYKDFKKILILVDEPNSGGSQGWSGENGLYIGAPAENIKQANAIAKDLAKKSIWLSYTNWD